MSETRVEDQPFRPAAERPEEPAESAGAAHGQGLLGDQLGAALQEWAAAVQALGWAAALRPIDLDAAPPAWRAGLEQTRAAARRLTAWYHDWSERVPGLDGAGRRWEELLLQDSLTGVLNRRAFEHFARLELSRARRYRFPLCLALFDLDHFKSVNDQLGHLQGDRVLRAFAQALKNGARDTDLVARLGGDEFAVLMPHAGAGAGQAVVARLQAAAAAALADWTRDARPPVGASAGLAEWSGGDPEELEQLVVAADQDLYRNKRGRRREGTDSL